MKKILFAFALLLLATQVSAADLVVDSVSYSPAPAIPGEYFDLYITLKNNSKFEAESVEFELDLAGGGERPSDYPFSLGTDTSNKTTVSTIKARKSGLIEYRVRVDPTALDGTYIIVFRFSDSEALKEYNYTINVLSRQPDIEVIRSSHSQVAPGQVAELDLTIRNIGTSIANDIMVGIQEDRTVTTTGVVVEREFAAVGASFAYIKELEPGKERSAIISLAVNPDAEQKTYTVPITVNFKDTNSNTYSDTSYIGLKVSQEPELDAVVSDISPIAFPGGHSEITVDLFNVGIGTAKYVVAEVSSDVASFDQEKIFIGTLEADDFDSFKVDATIAATADPSKENKVSVVLKYKNQYGEDKEISKELSLKVNSLAEIQAISGANPLLGLIGIISLVLQLVGLYVVAKWLYKRFVKKG